MSDPRGLRGRRNVAVFDERRNSSRVFPVSPEAVREARAALARFAAQEPAHARWIADGAPRLTDAEHRERFGEPYSSTMRRRPSR